MESRPLARTSAPAIIPRLLAVFLLVLGPTELNAQASGPKTGSVRVSSANSPEQLAMVELVQAVRVGDLSRAETALASAPTMLVDVPGRQSLLNLAAREGHPAIVRWLLEKGATPNDPVDRVLPLAAALDWTRDISMQREEGSPEAWKLAEQTVRETGKTGSPAAPPPISAAAAPAALEGFRRLIAPMPAEILARKAQVVELLLAAGAKPAGAAAPPFVYLAVQVGFGADVINALIQAGADPRAVTPGTNHDSLHIAVIHGNLGAAEALLAHRVDMESLAAPLPQGPTGMQIASGGTTPLMTAIVWKQEEMARLLLEKGARLETTNRTLDRALHFAATTGQTGILRLLLERGARIDASDRWQSTPLHYAALKGHLEAVKMLHGSRANLEAVDEAGFTPLLNATEHDRLETVRFLLAQGASRRARTDAGKGPLRVAATTNALQVAEFLLGSGEKVDGEPADNMRPLHEAASSGHPQMVTLLLQHGATTETRDRAMQSTALCMAIRSQPESTRQWLKSGPPKSSYAMREQAAAAYLEIVRLLVQHGADLDATDRWRNTALHYAAEYGDRDSVSLLLQLGARRDPLNERNLTPREVAWLKGHREIAALLESATPAGT